MRKVFYWVVAGVLIAVACVQTRATVLNPTAKRAPVCPDAVIIYTSADKVGKQFTEVAILDSRGDNDLTSVDQMHNSMRKKAAELGATGVILGDTKDASTGAQVAQAFLGTSANRKGQATAIYIPEDSARVISACVPRPER